MRIRDRIALAWRGYWAEQHEQLRQMWLETREERRDFQAERRETSHWDLVIRRKITGKQDPARKDVRRAMREYRKEKRR